MTYKHYWVHDESESCGYLYDKEEVEEYLNGSEPLNLISKASYDSRVKEGYIVTKPIKKLRHAMIDLESMATTPDAAIVSVGIIIFDPRYGKVSDQTFYRELEWEHQERCISPNTRQWWSEQSKEARAALHGLDSLEDILLEIVDFLPQDCKVWGNGSIFDIAMLEDAYRQYDIDIPWEFWNVRDCRTVLDMYESQRGGFNKKSGGTLHNALDDARYQAQYITMMWNKLLGDKEK